MNHKSNTTKLREFLSTMCNKPITLIHDEANGYCFKDGEEWRTVGFAFANSQAGLGYENRSLLQDSPSEILQRLIEQTPGHENLHPNLSYTTTGPTTVQIKYKNCDLGEFSTSMSLNNIKEFKPLVAAMLQDELMSATLNK